MHRDVPTSGQLYEAAVNDRKVTSRHAEIVSACINLLVHRVSEASFECACDVLSSGGPCCACVLRASLEAAGPEYMNETIKTWLARDHKAIRGERSGRHA